MKTLNKIAAATAALALMAPGIAQAAHKTGKAGAPGQVCKSLKVKGHKTAEQRAAYKKCVRDAAKARSADKVKDSDDSETTPESPAS